jgi:hypothetical protein
MMNKLTSIFPRSSLMCCLVAGIALNGCSAGADGSEPVAEQEDDLYRTGTIWNNGQVNVCIDATDNGGDDKGALMAVVQRVLGATWGKYANLSFKGSSATGAGQPTWGTCEYGFIHDGNYSTIALHFCSGTSTSTFCTANGTNKDYDNKTRAQGAYRGVTNNGTTFFFGPVPPTMFTEPFDVTYRPGVEHVGLIGDDVLGDRFQTRFRYQIIHEFGHALGFRHEQDRPENATQGICDPDGNPRTLDINTVDAGSPYGFADNEFANDNNSIMSYCSRDTLASAKPNFAVLLAGTDIRGARIVYGKRPAAHGFMILSDADQTFAVRAAGGAHRYGGLVMSKTCSITNPDCTWTYQRGMLVSDADPTLVIRRYLNSGGKYSLMLDTGALSDSPVGLAACTPADGNCTWTYRKGMFLIDKDQTYGLNAKNGVAEGNEVMATPSCKVTTAACLWTLPNVMLTSDRDSTLPINAYGGASDKRPLKVNQDCNTQNGSCTFTFHRGMIQATGNTALAWNAVGGALATGGAIKINSACSDDNASCTWEWSHGLIKSDDEHVRKFYVNAYNGGIDLNDVLLHSGCTATNPDCVFSGFSARN